MLFCIEIDITFTIYTMLFPYKFDKIIHFCHQTTFQALPLLVCFDTFLN